MYQVCQHFLCMKTRIKEIVDALEKPTRKFREMEELTGVAASSWQNVCEGKQRANEDHILVIGRIWPKYAYWLATGQTDEKHGHTSPILERIARDLKKAKAAKK